MAMIERKISPCRELIEHKERPAFSPLNSA
jgi:hypothetical protein